MHLSRLNPVPLKNQLETSKANSSGKNFQQTETDHQIGAESVQQQIGIRISWEARNKQFERNYNNTWSTFRWFAGAIERGLTKLCVEIWRLSIRKILKYSANSFNHSCCRVSTRFCAGECVSSLFKGPKSYPFGIQLRKTNLTITMVGNRTLAIETW